MATVFLIKDAGNADFDGRVKKFLCGKLDREPRTGVICFDEYKEDIMGKIYATASDTRGVGLAIYNRMLKASGFNIIEI